MDEVKLLWIVGIGALLIGGLIGMWIGRSSPAARRGEALREELDSTRRELESYKMEVNSHFARTADLVNKLTESYRDVHQHLASSAGRLCDEEGMIKSLQPPQEKALEDEEAEAPAQKTQDEVEPPRDYALKRDPKQRGTLSEDYGLREKGDPQERPHDPSRTADHHPR